MKLRPDDAGFTLVEVLVALIIMAVVGLMAWRGMDAMIRGRETIDRRSTQDASYVQLVRQFERDCQEMLTNSELGVKPYAAGAKNVWWVRRYRLDNIDAWMIVGFGMTPAGLQRWTSRPLKGRADALTVWQAILSDPDLLSSEMKVSLEIPEVVSQQAQVLTSDPSATQAGQGNQGAPATPATPTTPGGSGSPTTANPPGTQTTSTDPAEKNELLNGITMSWGLKNMPFPITRSCLAGTSL
ncbi:MAG: prepilin-type N-terminal cleavage/methylation domain-containing protein [Polynucleobacter sp.]|nr:prepilin-type N-terminal cleavage/methylation domain-containing protein [Polynucleobacter sp.]